MIFFYHNGSHFGSMIYSLVQTLDQLHNKLADKNVQSGQIIEDLNSLQPESTYLHHRTENQFIKKKKSEKVGETNEYATMIRRLQEKKIKDGSGSCMYAVGEVSQAALEVEALSKDRRVAKSTGSMTT